MASAWVDDLVAGAAFRADLSNSDRVTRDEWIALANMALRWVWREAIKANPHAIVSHADVMPAAGGSVSFDLPADFLSVVGVVANPDTPNEYTLQRFGWANRRGMSTYPFAFPTSPGLGLQWHELGGKIYIEPAARVDGGTTFRVWYVPQAPIVSDALPPVPAGHHTEFDELLMVRMAIDALARDNRDASALLVRQRELVGDLRSYWRMGRNAAGPAKLVDTDNLGPRRWYW